MDILQRNRIKRLSAELEQLRGAHSASHDALAAHISQVHDDVVRHADTLYKQSLNHTDQVQIDAQRLGGLRAHAIISRDLRHDLHRRIDAFEQRVRAQVPPIAPRPAQPAEEGASSYVIPDQILGAWRAQTLPEDQLYWELLPEVEVAVQRCASGKAFDVQAAHGDWVRRMRDAGIDAQGCETNANLRAVAASEESVLHDLTWRAALGAAEPGAYAAISCFGLLARLPVTEAVEYIQAASAALASGGVLILEMPISGTPLWGRDPTYCTTWTPDALEAMLAGFGLNATIRRWGALPELDRKLSMPHTDPDLAMLLYGPQHIVAVARKPETGAV